MNRLTTILGVASALALATSVGATLPMPSDAAAPRQAQPFLFKAGAGDIFEIITSQTALKMSSNPNIRAFASMLIADHTQTTNNALATATAAGVMPPPPELSPMQKNMVSELKAAAPADFDRVFLAQQLAAHQQALALMQGYASQGDVAPLRDVAARTVPIVQGHIAQVQQMMR